MADIWLVTVGEHLPLAETEGRLMRTALLARHLTRRNHRVTWWTGAFDHYAKAYFSIPDSGRVEWEGGVIRFLHGRPYRRNVSLHRLLNHAHVASDFARQVERESTPDAILCSFPTIELSDVATRWGRSRGVPVWLDVRDLWPDLFALALPAFLRPAASVAMYPYRRMARRALRAATGIVGITPSYLDWAMRLAGRVTREDDLVAPITYERHSLSTEERVILRSRLADKGVDWSRTLAVFVGSLGRTYDLAPILDAARRFLVELPQVQFVVAGSGDQSRHWQHRASGLGNVVFTGWLTVSEVSALLEGAAVGLGAYAEEAPQSIPNKIVEYLAFGLPLLSSLQGETAALLASTGAGATFRVSAPDGLTEPLRALLMDEPRRAAMANAARATFAARFSSTAVHRSLETMLLSRPRSPAPT